MNSSDDTDSAAIAAAAVSTWGAIAAALSPIIGHGGVVALYKRSLHLTRANYPWLSAADESEMQVDGFAALGTTLAQQACLDASAAQTELLHTFRDLLLSLIGSSLTERLLGSVWDSPSSGHAGQDTVS